MKMLLQKEMKKWISVIVALTLILSMSTTTAFAATKPGKVTDLKVKSTLVTSITLSWKKVSKASGYQIYRSTSKSGTYKCVGTVTSGTKVTYKDTGLKSNKRYYYKVRAYKKSSGSKIKGYFSTIVSGKTQKSKVTKVYEYVKKKGYFLDDDYYLPGDYCIESETSLSTVNGRLVQDRYIISIEKGNTRQIYLCMYREYLEDSKYTYGTTESSWITIKDSSKKGPVSFFQSYYTNDGDWSGFLAEGTLNRSKYTAKDYSSEKGITNLKIGYDLEPTTDKWSVKDLFTSSKNIVKGSRKLLKKAGVTLNELGFTKL